MNLRVCAQLVRLPALPTALADICLGALATGAWRAPAAWLAFVLLLLTSGCLYCAGMVWNDYFDVEQDKRERPFRPIPSGQVTRRQAAGLGTALLIAGALFALLAGLAPLLRSDGHAQAAPILLALALVAAIFLYDAWLKRTLLGPVGMGACRFFNVLLGLTVLDTLPWSQRLHLALVVGVYIVGVTWFARTEAQQSSVTALLGAASVMLASLLLALPLAQSEARPGGSTSVLFPYLLVSLGFVVGQPVFRAIQQPTPRYVQAAVHRALMGLILLDAVLATALAGIGGLLILLLLTPGLYLQRKKWMYAT
jgi:4-hydroxybenzoate polyprenyltransferase